jgi:ankyrin repeat protein
MTSRALMICLAALAAQAAASRGHAQAFTETFNNAYYTIVNAAAANNSADVRTFIVKRANVNSTDLQGRTALSFAAELGNTEMAKELLDARAAPDQRDKLGNVPLHWAANNGRVEVLKVLLAARAAVDAPDRQGITPLMGAIAHNQPEAMKVLLAAGADPHRQDFTGRDAFGWATNQPSLARLLQAPAKP